MSEGWDRACLALDLLGASARGLGGAVIRMRAGPDRDRLLDILRARFPQMRRIAPSVDDTHLFGGIDIARTLASGHTVTTDGLLAAPRVICLTMAERCPPHLAARLAQYLDRTPDALLIALDEGIDETETVPATLAERLAFHIAPEGHAPGGWPPPSILARTATAIARPTDLDILTRTALSFGIASMRAPQLALRAACLLADREARPEIADSDIATAAALVFAHRATCTPEEAEQDDTDPTPEETEASETREDTEAQQMTDLPEELVVEAVRALLSPEVLAGLGRLGATNSSAGQGAGQKRQGNRRGRPLPSRPGRLDGRNRLDMLATLRAAAPWQPLRRKATPDREGLLVRPSDFRVKRSEIRSDRLIVFAVDASGSAAVSRLNEAKGAIELLLARAYAARDHVSLVSFRGNGAETLLPPTRSLVQTRRKLSSLPGGGGTPLAAGLDCALRTSLAARQRGMSPVVILLTDGKSNIALDGSADRDKAGEDAVRMATLLRRAGLEAVVVDIARRPHPRLRDLAQHLDATYIALPRADAHALTGAVQSVLTAA